MRVKTNKAEKPLLKRFGVLCRPALIAAVLLAVSLCPVTARAGVPLFQVKKVGRLGGQENCGVAGHGGNYSVIAGSRTYFFLNNLWTGEQKSGGSLWGVADSGLAWSTAAPSSLPGSLSYLSDENHWPLTVIPPAEGENPSVRKLWPRAVHSDGKSFYLFYSVLHGLGFWPQENFRVGQGLAVAASPAGPYRRLSAEGSTSFWNDLEPSFGAALLEDSDGWIYLYGRGVIEPGRYSLFLARVKADSLADRSAYRYHSSDSKSKWTADLSEATPVAPDWDEEFSVSFNKALGRYLAVYCDGDGRVMSSQARYPWGPWDKPSLLFACQPQEYCRGAKEQPAFSSEDGARVFFTVEKKNVPYLYELSFK